MATSNLMYHVTSAEAFAQLMREGITAPAHLFSELEAAEDYMATGFELEDDPYLLSVDARGLRLRPDPVGALEPRWNGSALICDEPIAPERLSF